MIVAPGSVDHPFSLAAAIWLGIIGSFVLLILPVFVGVLIVERGFSESAAGWVGSADLMGFAAAAIVAFQLVRNHNWKHIVLTGLFLIVTGDVASVFINDFWPLFFTRFLLSGFGAGFVIAVPYTLLGDTVKPERNTGIYFTLNVLGGSAGLFVLPKIASAWGATGLFLTLAITAATAIPVTLLWLPRTGKNRVEAGMDRIAGRIRPVYLVLVGIALFNFGMGGVWAFVERLGAASNLNPLSIGSILSSTYLVGMVGSSAAAWQSARFGFLRPYAAGIGVMCLALTLLALQGSVLLYAGALVLMNVAWNYSITYQFSGVFGLDESGKMAVLIILVQAVGLMLGPGVAGVLVTNYGFKPALLLGGVMCVSSFLLFLIAHKKHQSA